MCRTKKVLSTRANFREDNTYVVCWIDGKFSITPQQWYNNVYIVVSDKEGNVILESDTDMLDVVLLSGDIDVDLSFIVTSTVSRCTAPIYLPESRFVKTALNKLTPVEWETLDPSPKPDPEPEPQPQPTPSVDPDGSLMLTSLSDGNIISFRSLSEKSKYQYQLLDDIDNTDWVDITSSTSIKLDARKRVQFKCIEFGGADNTNKTNTTFRLNGLFRADGSVSSMYDPKYNTDDATDTVPEYGCSYLFYKCTGLITSPELKATKLSKKCYSNMFEECTSLTSACDLSNVTSVAEECFWYMYYGCTSLINPPTLPAVNTVFSSIYRCMFQGCSSLKTPPKTLSATTLAPECYYGMFQDCTALTTAPELPATDLGSSNYNCYMNMFRGCTSLKTAPKLPATTLSAGCYGYMFKGCTSLTTAPELPATTLANNSCYSYMFEGCTGLKTAPKLPAAILAKDSNYYKMFSGCSSLKEIYCSATDDSTTDKSLIKSLCSTLTSDINDNEGTLYLTEEYVDKYKNSVKSYKNSGGKWKIDPYDHPVEADGSLMFTALEDDCKIGFAEINQGNKYEYQLLDDEDNKEWISFNDKNLVISLSKNQRVQFRCTEFNENTDKDYFQFNIQSLVAASGSVSSMYHPEYADTDEPNSSVPDYGCLRLFKDCRGLVAAPSLPTGEALSHVYEEMFYRCWNLTAVPDLSNLKILNDYCCRRMFFGCTSIKSPAQIELDTDYGLYKSCYEEMYAYCLSLREPAPISVGSGSLGEYCFSGMYTGCVSLYSEEPLFFDMSKVDQLSDGCFKEMFKGCTSIKIPLVTTSTDEISLDWKILTPYCYQGMYSGCSSLECAPKLPSQHTAEFCYESMFFNCAHLELAPELPSTTVLDNCYADMFSGCAWITEAPELPAVYARPSCYTSMFSGTGISEIHLSLKDADSSEILYSVINDITAGDVIWDKAGTLYVTQEFLDYKPNDFKEYYNTYKGGGGTWHIDPYDKLAKPDGSLGFMGLKETNIISLNAIGTVTNEYQYQLLDDDNKYFPWTDYTLGTQLKLDRGKRVQFRCTDFRENTSSNYVTFRSDSDSNSEFAIFGFISSIYNPSYLKNYADPAPDYACYRLFYNCSAISSIPLASKREPYLLPASEVGNSSYKEMFCSCTGLKQAPNLPATILGESCYENMFSGCASLTTASELFATTLTESCYNSMFSGCIPLNKVYCAATTTATSALENWLGNVASAGDIYLDESATIFPGDSTSGIPTGWKRHPLSDWPSA